MGHKWRRETSPTGVWGWGQLGTTGQLTIKLKCVGFSIYCTIPVWIRTSNFQEYCLYKNKKKHLDEGNGVVTWGYIKWTQNNHFLFLHSSRPPVATALWLQEVTAQNALIHMTIQPYMDMPLFGRSVLFARSGNPSMINQPFLNGCPIACLPVCLLLCLTDCLSLQ